MSTTTAKKKKLAIIGANESIAVLIRKAKELGYETHVFAWQCGDVGEKIADYFYPISTSNKEEIYKKCNELGVCGVCSITSDFAAPTVSYVSRRLGFPCNEEKADLLARNKFLMREALSKINDTYKPKHILVSDSKELPNLDEFSFPVIVKPTDRWSSKGVTRVDDFEKLQSALKIAIEESLEKKAVIEEFIGGEEYSAECIVQNKKPVVLAFTKKETTGFPHYIETGHSQPAILSKNQKKYLEAKIHSALSILGITNSAAHVEFKITSNGKIGFIEIGARMGGDCIGTHLTPTSTGLDYVKMVIDVACGNKLDFTVTKKPKDVRVKFIINEADLAEINEIDSELIIEKNIKKGPYTHEVVDSSTRYGYCVFIVK